MRRHRHFFFLVAFLIGTIGAMRAGATIPLPALPDWESNPNGRYGTGLAAADLNGDGWVDYVVANGNDMARQPVMVWLNRGDGTFNANPDWTSEDVDFHGHCDLADVDGDGILDLAVAVYLGAGGFSEPGHVKLYRGQAGGTFSANPTWRSSDSFYCFSVSFGDIDMDGRPDLACATGDDYYSHPEARRVYRNIAGALETTPSWTSTESEYSLDVTWADLNGDGALDLAFAGSSGPNRIYFAQGGTLQRTAGWSSTDASRYANTITSGDVDRDGWIDIAVADNNQLGGTGKFKLYRNNAGSIATTPTWQSNWGGYGSHVSFIDIDEDGDLDLSTGAWWGPVRIYENVGGALGAAPAYVSSTGSVIENEVWEDFDNDAIQYGLSAVWVGDGARRLFHLPTRPVRLLLSASVDDIPIDPHDIYLDRDDGWIVLPSTPALGARIRATFASSSDVDLLLSNWDATEGEYLFRNTRNPSDVAQGALPQLGLRLRAYPNPADGPIRINLVGPETVDHAGFIEVFDVGGRRVMSWRGTTGPIVWDGRDGTGRDLPAGAYLIRWNGAAAQRSPITTRVIRR